MSPLDKAYLEAANSKEKQSAFYNLFLNSRLYIPTIDTPDKNEHRRAGENESISPILLEADGVKYLMLFDSEERLSHWAKRKVGFAQLPGHVIAEIMNPEFHWILNVGTKHAKTFVPDEINWLKQTVTKSKTQQKILPSESKVLIGTPAKVPDGLIESLVKTLKLNEEVKTAYIGQVHYVQENNKPNLVLVLEIKGVSDSLKEAVISDITTAMRGVLGKEEFMDIIVKPPYAAPYLS